MLIKSTLLFVIAVFVSLTIFPSHGADIISCDMFENCPDGAVPVTQVLTASSFESVQAIDPLAFSREADSVEPPIFRDGFEGGLSGPFVSEVTIGPQGGDFNLSNGINLSIPPGAVPEETSFRFRVIQESEITLPVNIFKTHDIGFLAGFEATPYAYMFNQPISISIPAASLTDSTTLPFPMFMNTVSNEFFPINSELADGTGITRSDTNYITPTERIPPPPGYHFWATKIYVTCTGELVMPDLSALPLQEESLAYLALEKVLLESDCVANPCRCCDYDVVSEDFDSSSTSNDGCYSVYSNGSIKYLNCPGQPTEPWNLGESDLTVTVTPASAEIKVDEIVKFSFVLTNDSGGPVTGISITNVTVNDASVITTSGYDDSSVWFQGLSSGTTDAEITIEVDGCQYKAWLTVQVVDDVIFITDLNVVIVTEGCRNIFQVKLDSEPASPVNVTVSVESGDPDIHVESGSALSFDENNWSSYQAVTLNADWDADLDDGSTQIEISGITPDDEYIDVETKFVMAEEFDISEVTLAIDGSSSKFNAGPIDELHDSLIGTVTLDIVQGQASGHGILNYTGTGYGVLPPDGEICEYSIVGTGVVDVEGVTSCQDTDCKLSLWFDLYTDYIFYNTCAEPTPNIDDYGESEIVELSPQNGYVYDETDEYYEGEAHYIDSMRIEWLQPPGQ
ncbi:MAG: hypothetical protein WBM36_08710 [Lysobacterales bacterium]